ncbi:MAG: tetratricopeptide repeat protein [Candidatus Sulfotelmatobacter sp.]
MIWSSPWDRHPATASPALKILAHRARLTLRATWLLMALCSIAPFSLAAENPQDLLAEGRVDQAIQLLQGQIQRAPNADSYNLLCRAYFELDDWNPAVSACETAVSIEPGNSLYHLWLGRAYGEKADRVNFLSATGLARKVRSEFERAVELSPSNSEARTDLAEFYLEAPGIVGGGKDKARAQANLLMPLNPALAHWVMARMAEKNKDNAIAEQEYRAAVEASHEGARALANLAGFYRHINRINDMEQALHTLELSRNLDRPAALVDAAHMLLRAGNDYPLAIRLIRRYLSSGTTVEEYPVFKAHYLLGELVEKQGDTSAAAGEYREATALARNFRPPQDALKRLASKSPPQEDKSAAR